MLELGRMWEGLAPDEVLKLTLFSAYSFKP